MIGYERAALISGNLRWTDLTPTEWHDATLRAIAELRGTGSFRPYEKEFLRKDGGRVPVLVGGAAFGEPREQAVAFVVDLTERKRAEEALRALETDLAHMNRLSIMGELAASIAHEITQPIASARNNARSGAELSGPASRRDLDEAGEALAGLRRRGRGPGRAILDRIRDHIKKAPPRKHEFEPQRRRQRGYRFGASRGREERGHGPDTPCRTARPRSGGPRSAAASAPEPDPERGRGHRRR